MKVSGIQTMPLRKKILVTQTGLHPQGGADAVKTWMLEAMLPHYDITILSWAPVDFDAVNNYYGSDLNPSDFTVKVPPGWMRKLINAIPGDPYQFQGYSVIMRWCKLIRHGYDVLITSHDETDFGARGIQYVHYPYQEVNVIHEPVWEGVRRLLPFVMKWLNTRLRLWRIISGFSFRRMKRNLTLVNSEWTGALYKRIYDAPSMVLYPTIPDDFPKRAWADRQMGFVCIGRLSAEKRVGKIIDILSAVRREVPDITLDLIGFTVDYDHDYYQNLRDRIEANSQWIALHEDISRAQLTEMVSTRRFGIHAMENEHFGIGVAEMVTSGAIVFAPNSGGPIEILKHENALLYQSKEDAVEKIVAVLKSEALQDKLRALLEDRREAFSKETFSRHLLEIIEAFCAGRL